MFGWTEVLDRVADLDRTAGDDVGVQPAAVREAAHGTEGDLEPEEALGPRTGDLGE